MKINIAKTKCMLLNADTIFTITNLSFTLDEQKLEQVRKRELEVIDVVVDENLQ